MNNMIALTSAALESSSEPKTLLKQTTCPYCGVGCGVDIQYRMDDTGTELTAQQGTPEHPANFGRLCVKGSNLLATNKTNNRLLHPSINNQRVDWETAISTVADKLKSAVDQYGPDSVAFYVSGQLLTEDYYVANKLIKGFIGTANIDTNSRLCMSSAVAAHKRAFGEDLVPCNYEDLELADLLVLIGSNAAWTHPVLFQRMERAKQRNPELKVIVIDPRKTATCSIADLHLPIKAGSDVALFNGLLRYLIDQNYANLDYIQQFTEGFDQAATSAANASLEKVAELCDVSLTALENFYQAFANTEKVISFFSQGVNQSSSGVDKGNAIINCHLATGKIGQVGAGPFSITGQPNAMGGREVGGLANMLAAHMDIDNAVHRDRVQRFWHSPVMAEKQGLKAVDLFEAMNQGKIKFVWIMATNPVVSLPNRNQVEAALRQCDTVVVSDVVNENDTLNFAHIKLPATGWSEKDGMVTNSERRISRQRGLLTPVGEARHDWQIISDVAAELGFEEQFHYSHASEIFNEHVALTAFENDGERALDLSGIGLLTKKAYDSFQPVQWPINQESPSGKNRLFQDNKFFTPSGKAKFVPAVFKPAQQQTTERFPFVLNTGRLRDQWHTMTRTGNHTKLLEHTAKPFLAMHPVDAETLSLNEGDFVQLRSKVSGESKVILQLKLDDGLRAGETFAPIHWSNTWARQSSFMALFDNSVDAISGQPESKHAAIAIARYQPQQFGLFVSRNEAQAREIFSSLSHAIWLPLANAFAVQFTLNNSEVLAPDLTKTCEIQHGRHLPEISAKVGMSAGKLHSGCWTFNANKEINLEWLNSLVNKTEVTEQDIRSLLAFAPGDEFLQGKVICTCFAVRENLITNEIKQGCNSVERLGEKLKCGTNCGSCRSELSSLIDAFS